METAHDDPAGSRARALHWIDVATTVVFGLEAAAKVLAFGFRPYIAFNTNKVGRGRPGDCVVWWRDACSKRSELSAYLRPARSSPPPLPCCPPFPCPPFQLDLAVVVVSVVVLAAETANARFLKALRVLRVLRPLRMLTRSQSMLMVRPPAPLQHALLPSAARGQRF